MNAAELVSPTVPSAWFDLDKTHLQTRPQNATKAGSQATTGHDQCDEARPVCERCKKGRRDCIYPEPRPHTTSSSKLGQVREDLKKGVSSSDEYEDEDWEIKKAPSDKPPAAEQNSERRSLIRKRSRARSTKLDRIQSSRSLKNAIPSVELRGGKKEKSLQPPTDSSSNFPRMNSLNANVNNTGKYSSVSTATSQESLRWSHLPLDLQHHLEYHQQLTYHHWFFKHDASSFIHTVIIEHALSYEPLLYAVVGFSAFQRILKHQAGEIQDFLGYYNQSVRLLRKSLADGQQHTDATLLTILQLATFEEYLGDWVNLFGHQKAAYGILVELYSPETIMETEVQRKILSWYSRFDLFAGLMAGHQTVLGREWFCAGDDYYHEQVIQQPENIDMKIEGAIASHRLTAMDMALLFAKLPRGEISIPDFIRENRLISERIQAWMNPMGPLLSDSKYLVTSFEGAQAREMDDIVDPYVVGGLYHGDLWSINFMILDWTAIELMHKYQSALMLQQEPPPEVHSLAIKICRLFEAIEYWPRSPPGAILSAHASLGMATIHLPKDEKHTMWCRKKLARVEAMGYIYPPTMRRKMAELWGLPEVLHWWLPNNEGYPPIVTSTHSSRTVLSLNLNHRAKMYET